MIDAEELHAYWQKWNPVYERFALYVKHETEALIRSAGIVCEVTSRAKALDSFVKKAFRKDYADPIVQTTDMAGVRVLTKFDSDRQPIADLVKENFQVTEFADKSALLRTGEFGYLGIHCQVMLDKQTLSDEAIEFRDLSCEVQIHTRAQNAWSEATHDLIYKPNGEVPEQVIRAFLRLAALTEVFDSEAERLREIVIKAESLPVPRILHSLEEMFIRLGGHQFDRQLSAEVIEQLLVLFPSMNSDTVSDTITSFVATYGEKLRHIYREYNISNDANYLLLQQPESLLIFNRLEQNQSLIAEFWEKLYPMKLLEKLATAWGHPLPLG